MNEVPTPFATGPVVFLLRHGERPPIPEGESGASLSLTEKGRTESRDLGARLGPWLRTLRTSPVRRCVETAEALRFGAGLSAPPLPDRLLGAPGVFVQDEALAWSNWERLGQEGVIAALVAGEATLPGMAESGAAARKLALHLVAAAEGQPGIHLSVSHDIIVATVAARLLGRALLPVDWPDFLDGLWLWPCGEELVIRYRSYQGSLPRGLPTR